MSILEYSIRAVNAYLKFESLLFELLDEAKIDVWKIQGSTPPRLGHRDRSDPPPLAPR